MVLLSCGSTGLMSTTHTACNCFGFAVWLKCDSSKNEATISTFVPGVIVTFVNWPCAEAGRSFKIALLPSIMTLPGEVNERSATAGLSRHIGLLLPNIT